MNGDKPSYLGTRKRPSKDKRALIRWLRVALTLVIATAGLVTVPLHATRATAAGSGAGKLTQVSYVWQNDDGAGVDSDTNQAAYNTAITSVKQGERLTLRTQISNTGSAFANDLALFYDHNNGKWTKVRSDAPLTATTPNCTDTEFICTNVNAGLAGVGHTSSATDPQGHVWMSYYDTSSQDLWVANYVGTRGSGCGIAGASTQWDCVKVTSTGDVGNYNSIAIDANGKAWISYYDGTNGKLMVASYIGGSAGTCSGLGGSGEWDCSTITSMTPTTSPDDSTSMAFDSTGVAYIAFHTTTATSLYAIHSVASGGDCTNTSWTGCGTAAATDASAMPSLALDTSNRPMVSYYTTLGKLRVASWNGASWSTAVADSGTNAGQYSSIAIDSNGYAWISYYSANSLVLRVANNTSGSWVVTTVNSGNDYGQYSSLAFGPDGKALVTYYDNTNHLLRLARYVGTGGGCGGAAWVCSTLDTKVTDTGKFSSLTFDTYGSAWVSEVDTTNNQLRYVKLKGSGEVQTTSGLAGSSNGATTSLSLADATPSTADCSGGGTWNNGKWFTSENGSGVSLPDGSSTAQCTEVSWVLDTSNATANTTYRFVVASATALRPDKGSWRGPIAVTNYPTLTMDSAAVTTRASKDTQPTLTGNCTDTNWGCETVDSSSTVASSSSVAFDPQGNPWAAYSDTTNHQLKVAQYVTTGGTGCADARWLCTIADTVGDPSNHPVNLRFDNSGVAWMAYYDNNSGDVRVAKYVATGGTGCGVTVTTWTCTIVDGGSTDDGLETSLAIDNTGAPWLSYYDNTNADLRVAHFVGSGGSGCTSSAWSCTAVATTGSMGRYSSIAIGPGNDPWVSYRNATNNDLMYARYVGNGGTGCDVTTWACQDIDDNSATLDLGTYTSMTMDASGKAWVSYRDETNHTLKIAHYVASGGTGCGGTTTWDCVTADSSANVGINTSIAIDSDGNPWTTYLDTTNSTTKVARCTQSSGKCAAAAWTSTTAYGSPTGSGAGFGSISFDRSGTPWFTSQRSNNTSLLVGKMKLPPNGLSTNAGVTSASRDAVHGDGRYRLDSGHSPRTETATTCSATVNVRGYCGIAASDAYKDSMTAASYEQPMLDVAAGPNATFGAAPSAIWKGTSTVAPSSRNIVMQVYRWGTTNAWETVTPTINTCTSAGANTLCTITAQAAGTSSEYYTTIAANYWTYWRVYQTSGNSAETLRTDQMSVSANNTAPSTPTSLAQFKSNGTTSISTGAWTNETTVVISATVADTNATDTDSLCVEILPIGNAFTNTETACGSGTSYTGTGVTATVTISGLSNTTQYHWQARTSDVGGLVSAWTSYGGNADPSGVDVGVDTTAPTTTTIYDGTTNGSQSSYNNGSLSQLSARWSAFSDSDSGIASYQYAIGTTSGGTDVANWTSNGASTSLDATGLSLRTSQMYYISIRGIDAAGNTSGTSTSQGQLVAPTLSFSLSSSAISLGSLNSGNSYTSTNSVTLTVSTNAYGGYVVRQSATGTLTSGSNSIPAYGAAYPSATTWNGAGVGYTSNDSSIQSSGDIFGSGTKYAAFSTTAPGDIVADHTTSVSGTPVASETTNIGYKVVSNSTQAAGTYSTLINLSCIASF